MSLAYCVLRYRVKSCIVKNVFISDWLPDFAWNNITELDKLEGLQGVMSSFVLYQLDWQLWYANKEPENLPLVGMSVF